MTATQDSQRDSEHETQTADTAAVPDDGAAVDKAAETGGSGEGLQEQTVALIDLLDPPLPALLRATSQELGGTPLGNRLDSVDDSAVQLRELVDTLASTPSLRALLRVVMPGLDGPAAEQVSALLAENPAQADVEAVRGRINAAAALQRKERRAARRAKAPVAERALAHQEKDRDQLRASRDRYRGRAEQLEAKNARLTTELRERVEAYEELAQRETSLRAQLSKLRSRTSDVQWLSGLLREALDTARNRAAHPAEARGADAFAALDASELHATVAALATASSATEGATTAEAEYSGGLSESPLRRGLRHMLSALAAPPPALTSSRELRVDVLGGGAEVGGSCVLVEAAGTRILVDCGNRPQGTTIETTRPRRYADALKGKIDAVVLTHAHNDHAGWVPALLAERPGIPVYATPATCDLLVPMWFDSAKVMSRNGLHAYAREHVESAIDAFRETDFHAPTRIGDLTIELSRAGHIVGAAAVTVIAGERRVLISGDVSAPGQESVGGFVPGPSALGADLMLLESTYAGDERALQPRGQVVKEFLRMVETTYDNGGIALVPAFALGRAQEVALLCAKYAPDVPVLIDGLARDVTDVYEQHAGTDGGGRRIFSDQIQRVPASGTRSAVASFRSGVVIATSGMLNQGPVVSWAHRVLPDAKSSLMVVGYQDADSPGRKLLRLAEKGGGEFELPGREDEERVRVPVRASVDQYQLGAHASAADLSRIVSQTQPQSLMLVHGEPDSQAKFAAQMRRRAQKMTAVGAWTSAP